MAICRDCGKDVIDKIQTIRTNRKDTIHICDECMKKYLRKNQNTQKNKEVQL